MQATRKLGAEHVVYLKQNVNGMAIIASFCDKSIPKIRISNETWVIVGSVAEPTITKFHLSWGEDGYAVSKHTPTRHLSRVAPLDIPLDMFIRRSPLDVTPFERERTFFNQVHASPDQPIKILRRRMVRWEALNFVVAATCNIPGKI